MYLQNNGKKSAKIGKNSLLNFRYLTFIIKSSSLPQDELE